MPRVHSYVKQCDGLPKYFTHIANLPPFQLEPRRASLSLETPNIKSHVHDTAQRKDMLFQIVF